MADVPTVTLGQHTIPVYGQRWRYAVNRLESILSGAGDDVTGRLANGGAAQIPTNLALTLGDGTYSALCALIPNLAKRMPEWEFNGYTDAEAAERGEYDPDLGNEPLIPEVIEAFEVAWKVNHLDKVIGGIDQLIERFVDPTVLRDKITVFVARMGEEEDSPPSLTSPSTNGTSDSTSSTPPSPMSTVSAG